MSLAGHKASIDGGFPWPGLCPRCAAAWLRLGAVSTESPWKGLLLLGLCLGISLCIPRLGARSFPSQKLGLGLFPAHVGLWVLGCANPDLASASLEQFTRVFPPNSAANGANTGEGVPRQGSGTQLGAGCPNPVPVSPAKSRSIALPMDLDAHVSSLLNSSSTSTVQRNTSSYKAATRSFPRVSTTPNQWDYKNIIEKLQVRGRAVAGFG